MEIGLREPPAGLVEALERLGHYFADRRTRQGLLARRLLSRLVPADAALADHLVRERRVATRMDGSLGGNLVRTAWAAWELIDLGHDQQSAGTVRLVGYLLSRLGQAPAGDPPMFVSADAMEAAPVPLPSGCVFDDPGDAVFAAGALALKVVLRAGGEERPAIRSHVLALRGSESLWALRAGHRPVDLAAAALGALALAPLDLRDQLETGARVIAAAQDKDGTWPDADFFHVLEAMIATGAPAAHETVQRAVPALLARQASDGSFGEHEERALIALRALLRAA
jgi:hypothetical protein